MSLVAVWRVQTISVTVGGGGGGGGGVMGNLSACLGGYKQLKLVSWGCQA